MPVTFTDPGLIALASGFVVLLVLLGVLAVLMPLFVYQIRNDLRRTAQALDTMNDTIERALGSAAPAPRHEDVKRPASRPMTMTAALESFPDEASVEGKTRQFGLGLK
jgi:hypothetical protein